MRRALLLCAGILSVTWLQFRLFPGHTYLQADTQIFLPILERLDTPEFLSRDLVATHPHVTYTVYDELTLFLHEALGVGFKRALLGQQLVCRASAILGVFLLVKATGLSDLLAFLVAALTNLGAALLGPEVLLVEYEPVPRGLAFGLILLAIGFLAREKPLMAGLSGGIALLYHAPTAAPFWCVVLLAMLFDRRLRHLLRPSVTALFVFALLLANLAQLQPGVVEPQVFFGKLSARLAGLERYRDPSSWVSLWAPRDIWHYLAVWLCGLWATVRIWPALNRQTRWFFVLLPLFGILSIPASFILLERLGWSLIPQLKPARELVFTVAITSIASSIAGIRAALVRRPWESWLWFLVVFALPMNTRVFELLRVNHLTNLIQLVLCTALAAILAMLLNRFVATRWRVLAFLTPLLAIFAIPTIGRVENYPKIDKKPIVEVASWAEDNTWGSSMFLFPDAGRELYPGIFRAESRRALWVDWESGGLVNYFESFATEWWDRWHQTMDGPFSPERLAGMLSLPIDYIVLKQPNKLAAAKPVFMNAEFVVYDSRDLRNLPLRLTEQKHK